MWRWFVDAFEAAPVIGDRSRVGTESAWAMGTSVARVRAGGRYQLPSASLNYGVTETFWCYQNMVKPSTEKVIPRKPGRPATGRDPVLTVRLPLTVRSAIETWAKQQKDKPSRSEAIRRLIEIALNTKPKRRSSGGEN